MIVHGSPTPPLSFFNGQVLKRFVALFMPLVVVLLAVVLVLHARDRSNERTIHQHDSASVVDLQAEITLREFSSIESDSLYLAQQATLEDFLAGRDDAQQKLENDYLIFCRNKGLYDQIRFLDESGMERVRINYNGGKPAVVPERELQAKATRYYFQQAFELSRGEIFVSPFDLNVEHGEIERPLKPVIRFATPVFDLSGQKRGILVLNYLGEKLLHKLSEVGAHLPGMVMLLNRDGYFLHGRPLEELWGFMFGGQHTFASEYPQAWKAMQESTQRQFFRDGGLFTFRSIAYPASYKHSSSAADPTPSARSADSDLSSPELIAVAYVPDQVLYRRSTQLLHRLLSVCAVVVLLLGGLVWCLAYASALRRQHENRMEQSETRLRTLSAKLLNTQEQERRAIARDLHDDLGQIATAIGLDVQRAIDQKDMEKHHTIMARAASGCQQLLDRIHELSTRLRPTILDDLGLREAVHSLVGDYETATGIVVRADLRFDRAEVPAGVAENLYRILQEAMTNVSRHAQTGEVFVTIHRSADTIVLTVRDQGRGLEPDSLNGRGLGILGMRERAELLGGTFSLESQPGQGTRICVSVPLDRA